jgi:hypothetical protein
MQVYVCHDAHSVWKANPYPEASNCNQIREIQSFEELNVAVSDRKEVDHEAGPNR